MEKRWWPIPPGGRIRDLDSLPLPAYEKLEGFPRGYRLPPFSYIRTPGTAISTSRGCIYRCSYCDRSVFKRSFRSNSAEYTYEHMSYLRKRFGIRHVNIYDDLFTVNRERIMSLCDKLAAEPLGVQFNCAVRVGHTDDALLERLKEAGCLMVSVGVESGDPEQLQHLKTGITLEMVRDTVARIQAKGLRAKGLFMMGVVGETEESIRKTSDFVIDLGLDDMNMSKFTPFPGAPCWDTIRAEGTFEEDWRLMNCLNFVFVPKGIESKERLDQLYNEHVKRFYTDPAWLEEGRKAHLAAPANTAPYVGQPPCIPRCRAPVRPGSAHGPRRSEGEPIRSRHAILVCGSGRKTASLVRGSEMFRSHILPTGWLVVLCTLGLACTRLPSQPTEEGSTRVHRILEQEEDKDDPHALHRKGPLRLRHEHRDHRAL